MEVFQDGGTIIKSWSVGLDDSARQQIVNISRLPFVISHAALMADGHGGYGMPIGGVFMADKAIVPYAIGNDIGCGVQLIETDLMTGDLTDWAESESEHSKVTKFLKQIQRDIPTGGPPRGEHPNHNMDGKPTFWESTSEREKPEPSQIAYDAINTAEKQLGTLGQGNHFLEMQRSSDGRIWFMIHSGSRSVGKKICDHWHAVALELNKKWHSALPDKWLAYLPWDTDEARNYWNDMQVGLLWAEENRRRMAGKVISAFGEIFGAKAWPVTDIHHNYAAWENHFGKNGIVHRKGAVRAQKDETVLIPGSMGTSTWVAKGLGNPNSFNTCQHGAGRPRSRGDSRRATSLEEMDLQLASVGVTLVTHDREKVTDESAMAYKDIGAVMEASTDLITPVMQLFPIGVVKG